GARPAHPRGLEEDHRGESKVTPTGHPPNDGHSPSPGGGGGSAAVTLRVWRGTGREGKHVEYRTEAAPGMDVLDVVHKVQAEQANDLAVRWNCKAGKCGSCSAEVNGLPRLMCMTRMSEMPPGEPITIEPMRAFPVIKDLVTDVSWNFEAKKK